MACFLTTEKMSAVIIGEFMWHPPENNSTGSAQANVIHNEFELYTFKITDTSFRANVLDGI